MKIIRIYPNHIFGLLIMILCVGCEKKEFQISEPYYPTQNLVSYFKFESDFADSLNYMKPVAGSKASFTPGKRGNAISFNGITDLITYNQSAFITDDSDYSVAFWIKPNKVELSGYMDCVNFNVYLTPSSKILGYVDRISTIESNPIVMGTWHHVTFTFTSSNVKIYINGQLTKSATINSIPKFSVPSFLIGKLNGNSLPRPVFSLDEMLVYNKALTPEEISRIYNFNK